MNSDPAEPDLEDAAWQIGQTFTDSLHSLTVAVTGESGNSYGVTVSVGTGSRPAISLTSTNSTTQILIAGVVLTVRLATTLPAQEKGLSGLSSLPSNQGMLFVFNHEDYWSFWMVDMKFPLDIIWFNAAGKVVWTEPDLQPCSSQHNCPAITPEAMSMYVLEVNAGFIAAHHITLGTAFSFLNV
jgi:hypothetical protein